MEARSSERIRAQPNVIDIQLEHAQYVAMNKNSGFGSSNTKLQQFSLLSPTDEDIMSRASALGVSLGGTPNKNFHGIESLKENETLRTLIMLKRIEAKDNVSKENKNTLHLTKLMSFLRIYLKRSN
jgi:hypothetical protein